MNKTEILKTFIDYAQNATSINRDEFTRICKVSKHQIEKWFGSFNALKTEAGVPRLSENETSITIKANSIEEIIEKCNIDTKVWQVDYFNTKELASGEFSWTVYFKRKKSTDIDFEVIKRELKAMSPPVPKLTYKPTDSKLLLSVNIFDTHLGKLAYGAETGECYDIKIAAKIYREAIDHAIYCASKYEISQVLFPIGQDFLHVDSKSNMTTAGTPQDSDSRATKIFKTGRELLVEAVEKLKSIAPVDVVCVPGNHEENSMFHLGDCVECRFWNDENVNVFNEPTTRKYYQWGQNLLAFAHGDKTKITDLGLLMASEQPVMWSRTKFRVWNLGHFHHQKLFVDEKTGVIIEVMPSISATDSWHAGKGYVKNIRGSVSCIYDANNGPFAKFHYNVG